MWLVPHLRFPEFTGEWRYSSLGKECNILCGYPFDGQDMQESCGNVKLLRGINITEGEIRHSNELDRYYSGDTSRLGKYILKEGDLVIGMDGSKVGRNSAILTICEQGSYLVQRVCRIRSQKHNVEYIFQHINNSKFHRHVDSVKTASAIPHISQSDIQDYVVSFPPTAEEQIKITSLLSLLDARIATQNKIIERLQSLMSGIVEKTFVSTRYAPLQHYAPIITSGKDKDSGGNYPLYGSTGIIGSVSKPSYTKTAVLIARVGSIGNVQYVTIPCGISDNTLIIDAGENNRFIYYYLNDYNFSHITSGTTQPLITASSVKKIAVPIIEKQRKKKIIAMMNSIEHKLCNEKHIASLLSRQKGFLISQMFI